MKFFSYNFNKNTKQLKTKTDLISLALKYPYIDNNEGTHIHEFNKFLIKDGLLLKSKFTLANVFKNFNFFLYQNTDFLYSSYPAQK